jgi:hypothetical protein
MASWTTHLDIPILLFLKWVPLAQNLLNNKCAHHSWRVFFFYNTKTGKWEGMDWEGYDVVIYIYINNYLNI